MKNDFLENNMYTDTDFKKSLQLFHLLRNETRLKILCLLIKKEHNVTELEQSIQKSQSAISHQLFHLKKFKLVKSRKVGKKRYYSIYDTHVKWIIYLILEHSKEQTNLFEEKRTD